MQKIYLSGEIPAHNYELLADYGITYVVLCERHHTCVHAPNVNYLKIASDSDFVTQIKIFVSFVESLSRSSYTVNLSPFSFLLPSPSIPCFPLFYLIFFSTCMRCLSSKNTRCRIPKITKFTENTETRELVAFLKN
jgi:hypothetical protein